MTTPARLSTVLALRHWNWDTRDAWSWLTNCQHMRDLVDRNVRAGTPESFARFLQQEHDFTQYEWFFHFYCHKQRLPESSQIDWEAILDRWLKDLPAQTIIPRVEDRTRCFTPDGPA